MVKITTKIDDSLEPILKRIAPDLREKAIKQAIRAAGRIVANKAKTLVPQPGYPGDKPGKKPLRDTFKVRVRNYRAIFVAVVGPGWPEGAHSHLVEEGHEQVKRDGTTGAFVPGKKYLAPAAEQTIDEQLGVMRTKLFAQIKKSGG